MVPFASTWRDLEIIILTEVYQTEEDKYHMILLIYGLFKNDTNKFIYETEIDPQTQKANSWLPKWKQRGRINWKFGVNIYTQLYMEQMTNEDLLYSTQELYSIFCDVQWGKGI